VTNDTMAGSLYLLIGAMLLFGALIGRREPWARKATYFLVWTGILASGFLLFSFRDDLGYVAQRVRAEATGRPVTTGTTVRIPMAIDGHFWIQAEVNGQPVRFLVDSGATMTTIDRGLATGIGIATNGARDQLVRTGNGFIKVSSGVARTIAVGGLKRRDVRLHIAENDDLNVLGMNFLSSLNRWSVEGRWLVLEG
jgi:aspartyl protease family protein